MQTITNNQSFYVLFFTPNSHSVAFRIIRKISATNTILFLFFKTSYRMDHCAVNMLTTLSDFNMETSFPYRCGGHALAGTLWA